MNKRTLSVGMLTAGMTVGLAASMISPAAAQGTPVGGEGNTYYLQGNGVNSGTAARTVVFGNADDEVYFGDLNGDGQDLPLVRRGNVYFVPNGFTGGTQNAFVYGNPDDEVYLGDWDGDGDDTLAVRRGNLFLVKNDNFGDSNADSSFRYGDAGDTVFVGNFDGAGTPGVEAVEAVEAVEGVEAVEAGPGPDNIVGNEDDIEAVEAVEAVEGVEAVEAVAPVPPNSTDTIMVQRGNQFFVSNDLNNATGVADYDFTFGDAGDELLVGDFATRARPARNGVPAQPAVSGNGADQLMVVRGNEFFQSSELADAEANDRNPDTFDVFFYGNVGDTAFTASTPIGGITGDSLGVRR